MQALRSSPALSLTIAGGVAMHFVLGAATFDQLWYVQERGFERAEIARMTGWIGMIAGVLGNLFGGMVGDWWLRRTGSGRAVFLFWLGIALAPLNIAYRMVPGDSPFFWIGVFTGYFGLGAFYGPTFSTVQELVPPQIRATVVAFYILMLNLIGLGFGITVGGWLIDYLKATGVKRALLGDAARVHAALAVVDAALPARRPAVPPRSRAVVRGGGRRGLAIAARAP